jgi:hypothetical protein
MPKTLYARDEGAGFKVAIFEDGFRGTGANDIFANPMGSANSAYVYFHSDLSFFRSPSSITSNLTLPARTVGQDCGKKKGRCVPVPAYGAATYTLATGNYAGKIVIAVDTVTNRSMVGTMFVQRIGDSTFRSITIYANSTGIYADEQYFAYSGDLPQITISIKLFILATSTENRTNTGEKLYIDTNNFRTNDSLFNSNFGYVDVDVDSSSASFANLYSGYYCSWNAAADLASNVIKRYVLYYPSTNTTKPNTTGIYWDAFKRYDGTVEGVFLEIAGQPTSGVIGDYTYERGPLFDTKLYNNGTVAYQIYQIRRYKTVVSSVTRTAGVALPNGPTLRVESAPGFVSAGFSYSFDGYSAQYGDITTYPTNTIYAINLK